MVASCGFEILFLDKDHNQPKSLNRWQKDGNTNLLPATLRLRI